MAKQLIVLGALGVVGACAQQGPTTSIAHLGTAQLEIVANGNVNVLLHVDETGGSDCPVLADDAHALFDGQPMMMTNGGYDTDSRGCYPIAFWFNKPDVDAMIGFEKSVARAELVIEDKTASWGVNTSQLFASDFVDDPANSRIVWNDVTQITSAFVVPSAPVKIEGNSIGYPAGFHPDYVSATSHPVPTLCDGPAVCTVNLQGGHTWTVNP